MKIEKVNYNYKSPTFEAIHPSRYFIKCEDGHFCQVTNPDTIRALQGKVIKWLNQPKNDAQRLIEGNPRKTKTSETAAQKAMKERLISFFQNNDSDYKKRQVVKSVYLSPKGRDTVSPYILTGDTVDLAGDGKPIGKVHGNIRESREYMRAYYGISEEQASRYVSAVDANRLSQAKADYHRQSEECVRKLMQDEKVDRSIINLYFEPVIGKKSKKKVSFNLVNAIFQKIMIQ